MHVTGSTNPQGTIRMLESNSSEETIEKTAEATIKRRTTGEIVIITGSGDDNVTAQQHANGSATVIINGEVHEFSAREAQDLRIFLGEGNDSFVFTESQRGASNIYVYGGGGDDFLAGGRGDDRLSGGNGDDTILGGRGRDKLNGGNGDDFIDGGRGCDDIIGGDGDDNLKGGRCADTLTGGEGDDDIFGGCGNDEILDYWGDNFIVGGCGQDIVNYIPERATTRGRTISEYTRDYDVTKLNDSSDTELVSAVTNEGHNY